MAQSSLPLPNHVVFEVTTACNCDCLYCYTPWKSPRNSYPIDGQLELPEIIRIFEGLKTGIPLEFVALSGGEPFLRPDLSKIVSYLWSRHLGVVIITNGTLLTEENIDRTSGVTNYELPLLSYRKEIHNRMMNTDSFDRIKRGMKNLDKAGAKFVVAFIATKLNYKDLETTIQLAFAMGAGGVLYNRMNVGGWNYQYLPQLLPTPAMIKENLETLEEMADKYKIPISCSIPIQPCLIDFSQYKHVNFGFCPLGGKNSYFTIDPAGNLRVCNHSSFILGNLRETPFIEMFHHPYVQEFRTLMPDGCRSCAAKIRDQCHGGCKMAAEECYESFKDYEPFVQLNLNERVIPQESPG
jgi:radical SAM protein with 4Fe4S-binding SPASM domain